MSGRRFIPALVRVSPTLAILASAVPCLHVWGQSARLRPVEQGVADQGPLSASQRVLPSDLRVPSGFDRVYRVGPKTASGGMFARISGGITAVFPRSQYIPIADGYAAQTPAGTVYYIGKLPRSLVEDSQAPARSENPDYRPPGFSDRSARQPTADRPHTATPSARPSVPRPANGPRVVRSESSPAPSAPPPEPTIFTDEAYRGRRVAELLDAAAQAGNSRR